MTDWTDMQATASCDFCGAPYAGTNAHKAKALRKWIDSRDDARDDNLGRNSLMNEWKNSPVHEIVAELEAITPTRGTIDHECHAVRAVYWTHTPMILHTSHDVILNEHFDVRQAVWRREHLDPGLREMLSIEFGARDFA